MPRMVAIGAERFTLPFGAIGFETAEAGPATFIDVLRRLLARRAVGLVVCGESLVTDAVIEQFKELCAEATAAVLVVPDGPEARGIGHELMRVTIERAAGVDLLSSVEAEDAAALESAAAEAAEVRFDRR